ncbi:hypothetical protein BHM03_00034431, partial [Ensete ventricosum]
MNSQICGKNDKDAESSSSLRAKLEKVVDSIRFYESKRAKIEENEMNTGILINNKPSQKGDSLEISDAAIGAKLNILYGQKKAICADLATAHARERKVSEESRSLKHKIRKSILKEAEIVVTTLSGASIVTQAARFEKAPPGRSPESKRRAIRASARFNPIDRTRLLALVRSVALVGSSYIFAVNSSLIPIAAAVFAVVAVASLLLSLPSSLLSPQCPRACFSRLDYVADTISAAVSLHCRSLQLAVVTAVACRHRRRRRCRCYSSRGQVSSSRFY